MTDETRIISLRDVAKRFGPVTAVDSITLDVRQGEFLALLGPSGCGKTTLLRMVAGFENPSEGDILIDGEDMTDVPPNRRPINMVFQSYAVFPHMTVAQNVGYGLRMTGTPKAETDQRVREALEMVQLQGFEARKPDMLSGGQRQRVALARALVKRPKVLLLDEPLSALDAKLREAMQLELVRLQRTVGITFVIVTHDQSEALSMADRIVVMDGGRVRQIASPSELYESPANRFVADFIGKVNLFDGQVAGIEGSGIVVDVPKLGRMAVPAKGAAEGAVSVAVRPEKIRLSPERPAAAGFALEGRVKEIAYLGESSHLFVESDSGESIAVNVQNAKRAAGSRISVGDRLWVSWEPEDALLLTE